LWLSEKMVSEGRKKEENSRSVSKKRRRGRPRKEGGCDGRTAGANVGSCGDNGERREPISDKANLRLW